MLLPHLAGVLIEQVRHSGAGVIIEARAATADAMCPGCGRRSARVHGRYRRRLADLPLAGRPVAIRLTVQRFVCIDDGCPRATFVEQIAGLTAPHARATPPLLTALTSIAAAVAGRAGARLVQELGIGVGRDTLLNRLRALPDPEPGVVEVLGVDDFALRRGHVYATVLVDMATHRPVEVLAGREAEPLAAWLRAHPGVTIVCRDRAGAYADGARAGAPQAIQVADRWHLWHNLGEAVAKTVTALHGTVRAALCAAATPADPSSEKPATAAPAAPSDPVLAVGDGMLDVCGRERRLVARTRGRYAAITEHRAAGTSVEAIARDLGLDRSTIRRFARADSVEELLVNATNRASVLDGYSTHLLARFQAGVSDATVLHAELVARGYPGSVQTVRRFLHPLRTAGRARPTRATRPPAPPPRPEVPKPRRITRWIMTDPDRLTADDAAELAKVLDCCPELAATATHVRDFATLMRYRRGEQISGWLERVEADSLPALHSLATGLRRDLEAVINGLRLPWSSGAVEGTVNRVKMLKRQMYGRANLDLLRTRVLHPA